MIYKTNADGSIFKELRKKVNMTQIEVANYMNVQQNTVSKWERGLTVPDQSILPKIAELYNTTVDYLLTGKDASIQTQPPVLEGVYYRLAKEAKDCGLTPEDAEKIIEIYKHYKK